jgi:hypothetical protein
MPLFHVTADGMAMGASMVVQIHVDGDAEKVRDFGHRSSVGPPPSFCPGLGWRLAITAS